MAIKEDIKPQSGAEDPLVASPSSEGASTGEPPESEAGEESSGPESGDGGEESRPSVAGHEGAGPGAPAQLGTRRFVYAAYFAGAIAIAFVVSKFADFGWARLQSYRPAVGEPREEIVMPLSGAIGAAAAVYYWKRTKARQLAEEVATEMSNVTWPNRAEVTNGTFVVIVTTILSTVFFALMDRFWSFISNLVYGGS